jgi:hypothetical protein
MNPLKQMLMNLLDGAAQNVNGGGMQKKLTVRGNITGFGSNLNVPGMGQTNRSRRSVSSNHNMNTQTI